MDKSLLLENEKAEGYYFRFETAELLRATEKERVEAVALGVEKGLYTINEGRQKLDLSNIDEDVFMWGLQNVLFNPETGEMKIPNMGMTIKADGTVISQNSQQSNQPQSNGGQLNGNESNKENSDGNSSDIPSSEK
jgi:hypothetical protein